MSTVIPISTRRRPSRFSGGMNGSINCHSSSLVSLVWRPLLR
jgi:hypothetical protein